MRKLIPLKAVELLRSTTFAVLCLYGLIALGLMAPMGSLNVLPNIMDTQNHVESIVQARNAIREHQIPLRVAPSLVNGWQYPLFQFYSPTPYMLGGLIYEFITPDNPYQAYALTIWLALVGAAFGIFLLVSYLVSSKKGAVLCGVAYMTAPYMLLNIHARGGFTEVCSQAVLPYVLFFSIKSFFDKKVHWLILGGLAWYLLITCHTITFLTLTILMALFVALSILSSLINGTFRQFNIWGLIRIGASGLLGIILAGYYLGPIMLFAGHGIQAPSSPSKTIFFTPLLTLLSPASVAQNPSQYEQVTLHFYPAVGWVLLFSFACMLYYLSRETQPGDQSPEKLILSKSKARIIILVILFAFCFFLTWSPFDFWQYIPGANFIQHAYRFLIHLMWIGSILLGYTLLYTVKEIKLKHILAGSILMVLASVTYLPSNLNAGPNSIKDLVEKPIISTLDYLYFPDLASPAGSSPQLPGVFLSETNPIDRFRRGKGKLNGDIQIPNGSDWVQLPVLYYPDMMEIKANDRTVPYFPVESQNIIPEVGRQVWFVGIKLPPGSYHISIDFTGLPWANLISLLGWIAVIVAGLSFYPLQHLKLRKSVR